jgi:hypothetical protein
MYRKRTLISLPILVALLAMVSLFGLSVDSADAAPPIQINFQRAVDTVPAGYVADTGAAYGVRANGDTYGWLDATNNNPVDASTNARNRFRPNVGPEQDTLMHMQYGDCCAGSGLAQDVFWEYAIANGFYDVTVSAGDQPGNGGVYDSQHTIRAEGTAIINAFQATAQNEFSVQTATIEVTDGVLTIDSVGGTNTKINYIHIVAYVFPDSDNDGFDDNVDVCPNTPGVAPDGCPLPDSDADGFPDATDLCPNTPGVAPNGCPDPSTLDTDGDGFNDAIDLCVLVAGVAPDGCPSPDTDGDGVLDAVDSCPTVFGTAPDGCPPGTGGSSGPIGADGRLNTSAGISDVAIYLDNSDPNNPALNVYCVNDNSQGYFGLTVSQSDIPASVSSNTLIASGDTCNVAFFVLSTGELQLNVGPDGENKVSVFIFSDFFMSNLYTYNYVDYGDGGYGAGASSTSAGAVIPLDNCRVTPIDIVNMRTAPSVNAGIMTMIPYDYTVEAIGRSGNWFNVIFGDENGWISGDWVTTSSDCG